MNLTDSDALPFIKGLFHGALAITILPVLAYNVACVKKRPEAHHWVNVGALGLLLSLEAYNVTRHWGR